MFLEVLLALTFLWMLTPIGLGPAAWFIRGRSDGFTSALGIAPALGTTILGLVAIPLARVVVNGIPFATFRSNPRDSLFYKSLAGSVQKVPGAVLLRGAEHAQQNLGGTQALARVSPIALITALVMHDTICVANVCVYDPVPLRRTRRDS